MASVIPQILTCIFLFFIWVLDKDSYACRSRPSHMYHTSTLTSMSIFIDSNICKGIHGIVFMRFDPKALLLCVGCSLLDIFLIPGAMGMWCEVASWALELVHFTFHFNHGNPNLLRSFSWGIEHHLVTFWPCKLANPRSLVPCCWSNHL